jgi:hypothetical protein
MKQQMSAQQTDNLTFLIVGLTSGLVKYFNIITLNIQFWSHEWITAFVHAGITAGFCGVMGIIGKKIGEYIITYFNEYKRARKDKKQTK